VLKRSASAKNWQGSIKRLLRNIDEQISKNWQTVAHIKKYKIYSFFQNQKKSIKLEKNKKNCDFLGHRRKISNIINTD
jgi:hypothetical protein